MCVPSPSEVGRAGIARARRRGLWASLVAVAACGGVRECNLVARVGWEAWAAADSPAIGHGPEEKRKFLCILQKKPKANMSLLLDNIRLRAHDIHTNHNLTF